MGQVLLILHTHLPYVHHPHYDDFLEEDWLFEAMTETYLPLLFVLRDLERDGVPFKLSFSLTPPLLHMLRTPQLMLKFRRFIERRLELAESELKRQTADPLRQAAARHYRDRFNQMLEFFEERHGDVVSGFVDLHASGQVEILASAATHGFLPLLLTEEAIRAQIGLGLRLHEETFGKPARGFWLPECAYRPGLDRILKSMGIEWIVLDGPGIETATPTPPDGTFSPITLPSGVVAFGRDPECSQQIWSSIVGYPGDPAYRELYRDIGYDADYRYIRPWLKSDGVRRNIGMKYHRITGDVPLHEKELWDVTEARARATTHAGNFLFNRSEQIKFQGARQDGRVIVTAPFDTELFGHWWYEGPWFLEEVFRQAAGVGADLPFTFALPREMLDEGIRGPRGFATACSWGQDGFFHVWLNDRNQWVWPHLHEMEERLIRRLRGEKAGNPLGRRILGQMARELLLAQSSDWPFIISMDTATYYAEQRLRDHIHRFFLLEEALDGGPLDVEELDRIEEQDAIFPRIDLDLFTRPARR